MKLRVLIAEDEPISRERLRRLLDAEKQVQIVAECSNGDEALAAIRQTRPDLVLLDIRMPARDGFEVLRELKAEERPAIIIVTASDQFAMRAFEIHAVDYLLKPFDQERLHTALDRARARLSARGAGSDSIGNGLPKEGRIDRPDRLAIKEGGRISLVQFATIDWIAAADNYAELHVGTASHLLRTTITQLVEQLPADSFIRISRSTLVNVNRIKEIRSKTHGDYLVLMASGAELTATRTYREELMRSLGKRAD